MDKGLSQHSPVETPHPSFDALYHEPPVSLSRVRPAFSTYRWSLPNLPQCTSRVSTTHSTISHYTRSLSQLPWDKPARYRVPKSWEIDGLMVSSKAFSVPTHSESRQQPHSSGHSAGYSSYMEGPVPPSFPEPGSRQYSSSSSTGQPATYLSAPLTIPQSAAGQYQQERQSPYGYHQPGMSPSSIHRTYPPAGSPAAVNTDLYTRSEVPTYAGPGHPAKSQDWDARGYEEEQHGPDFRDKGPQRPPVATHSKFMPLELRLVMLMSSSQGLNADILLATTMFSSIGVSTNLGSGVVKTIWSAWFTASSITWN